MKRVKSSGNSSITPPLYKLTVTTEDHEVPMEVDTGSSETLLSSADFSKIGGQVTTLRPPTVLLKSCTEDIIQCLGEKEMDVKVGDQVGTLLIRVVQGPSLLGRDMMSNSEGKLKGIQVSLRVSDESPVFTKARVVPFAIWSKYEKALEKLVAEDIIEKVEHSECASPTV
ncbi:unnamed protein product, partial [Porites lobata]